MALSTFGAIMGFAAEMVGQTKGAYETLVGKAKNPTLRETFQAFLREEDKTYSLMEKTRRENVTEMILEPITGLHQENYEITLKVQDQMEDSDLVKIGLVLEKREKLFFQDASSKVPLSEVARIFKKIVQKKEENLTKLQSLGLTSPGKKDT